MPHTSVLRLDQFLRRSESGDGALSPGTLAALDRAEAFPAEACRVLDDFNLAAHYVDARHGGLWSEIATKGTDKKAWNDLTTRMKSVLGEFGKEFAPDVRAA